MREIRLLRGNTKFSPDYRNPPVKSAESAVPEVPRNSVGAQGKVGNED